MRVAGRPQEDPPTAHPPALPPARRSTLSPVSRNTGSVMCTGDRATYGTGMLEVTIEAANVAIGRQGHDAAYRHLQGRVGIVPDYFWLDTLQRPDR